MRLRLPPLCCLPLVCHPALADTQQYDLTAGADYYTLKEFGTGGARLVREEAILPGARLAWREQREHLIMTLDAALAGGPVHYDGQTQSGLPHTTRGWHLLPEVGVGLEWPARTRLRAYGRMEFEADFRYLDDKGAVAGATEFYQRLNGGLGLALDAWRGERTGLTVRAGRLEPLYSVVNVYSRTGTDDLTLRLDNGSGWEASADYVWKTAADRQWLLSAACRNQEFDPSPAAQMTVNGAPIGYIIYQPEIHFHRCGLRLGLRMPLGAASAN
ncbi:hypothetical protein EV700_2755 [Fluviicoccus keumensis]|uniref:Uncharacterized protein n=1 Tax=Fluviicoccus keumensis TaxID=1435465 RepID=A0A4Q7YKV3_9GAMM|nr:hypothetical protein [Fluviicoccus keumensis]RZU38177.1 hypothetical protein EV700_2755 [Fluviicoccus keumensis]